MLNKERIKEAESNVRKYLSEGLLKKQKNDTALEMYRENCDLSLETAQRLFNLETEDYKPFLWIITTSYYAMFYIANAVLLNFGYKVGEKISHKITIDSLIVYVRNKLKKELLEEYEDVKEDALEIMSSKADSLLESLDFERRKRSKFQYKMDEELKKSKAMTSFNRAKKFVFELKKLL
jgi:uncharacterized protein (UPF0332 family)